MNQLLRLGKHAEAIASLEKQLARERKILGEVHDAVALSLRWLAYIHENREDFRAARKAHEEIVTVRIKLHGEEHWRAREARLQREDVDRLERMGPDARTRVRQANALSAEIARLRAAGKPHEALLRARKVLAVRQELWGEDHPQYAVSLNNLAAAHRELGEFREARDLCKRALAILQRALGEAHPTCVTTLYELAQVYANLRESGKARVLFEQALTLNKSGL